ncbi:MAG: hypothetical protein QM820_44110 [Minicystis sp.]
MAHRFIPLALAALTAACSSSPPVTPSDTASSPSPTQSAPAPSGERLGRVVKATDTAWAIVPADDDSQRYCFQGPFATPNLLVEGKKVRFAGKLGPPPAPNVRLACQAFEYTSVAAAD